MADHSAPDHHLDLEAHRAAYGAFVRGAIAVALLTAFTMVALCSFAFAKNLNVLVGFAGLVAGVIAVLIDARSGSHRWFLSLGVLVVFALITAINVA